MRGTHLGTSLSPSSRHARHMHIYLAAVAVRFVIHLWGLVSVLVCSCFACSETCPCSFSIKRCTGVQPYVACAFVQELLRTLHTPCHTTYTACSAVLHCKSISMIPVHLCNTAVAHTRLSLTTPSAQYQCAQRKCLLTGGAELARQAQGMAPRLGRSAHLSGA